MDAGFAQSRDHSASPTDNAGILLTLFQVPIANMVEGQQSSEYGGTFARTDPTTEGDNDGFDQDSNDSSRETIAVASIAPYDHPDQDESLEIPDAINLAAEKANRKVDHEDDDFTLARKRRKSAAAKSSPKKLRTSLNKHVSNTRGSSSKTGNTGKTFESCRKMTQIGREKHFQGIKKVWGDDPSSWPVCRTSCMDIQNTNWDLNTGFFSAWTTPFLERVERLAQTTTGRVSREKLEELLKTALRDQNGKSVAITKLNVPRMLELFPHESNSTRPNQIARSPTFAPAASRVSSIDAAEHRSPTPRLHATSSMPAPPSRSDLITSNTEEVIATSTEANPARSEEAFPSNIEAASTTIKQEAQVDYTIVNLSIEELEDRARILNESAQKSEARTVKKRKEAQVYIELSLQKRAMVQTVAALEPCNMAAAANAIVVDD